MLIEDYIYEVETPYSALKILNDMLYGEISENYHQIKRGDQEKVLNKILAISYMNTFLIKKLQKDREKVRKTINNNYKILLKEEI